MASRRPHYLATVAIVSNDLNLVCVAYSFIEYRDSGWFWGWVALTAALGLYVCGVLMAKLGDDQQTASNRVMLHYAETKLQELDDRIEAELEAQEARRAEKALDGKDAVVLGEMAPSPPRRVVHEISDARLGGAQWAQVDAHLELQRAAADARSFSEDYRFILHHSRREGSPRARRQRGAASRSRRGSAADAASLSAQSYLGLFEASLAEAARVLRRAATSAPTSDEDDEGDEGCRAPLSHVATSIAKEEEARARHNRVDLAHAVPLWRVARFGSCAQCDASDVSGLLSVNVLHAFTLGAAQLLLGYVYLRRPHGPRPDSPAASPAASSADWPAPSSPLRTTVEASMVLSALSVAIALLTHAVVWPGVQASVVDVADAAPLVSSAMLAAETKQSMEEVSAAITRRKEDHMRVVWKRWANGASDFKPRLLRRPVRAEFVIGGPSAAGRARLREAALLALRYRPVASNPHAL